jgi:hypothetical protein
MAIFGWHKHQVDFVTAFLNSLLKEELYARPSLSIQLPKGKVWLLKRALYGLVQNPGNGTSNFVAFFKN